MIDEVKKKISLLSLRSEGETSSSFRKITTDFDKSPHSNKITDDEKNEILAIAAVKYAFLKVSTIQDMIFDIEESVKTDGNSGPYLLYTYARARSIIRNSVVAKSEVKQSEEIREVALDFDKNLPSNGLDFTEPEKDLLRILYKFPEVVVESAKNFAINLIANFLYELAQSFNSFYHQIPVNKTEDKNLRNFRLALVRKVAETLQKGLDLLGIKTLEEV